MKVLSYEYFDKWSWSVVICHLVEELKGIVKFQRIFRKMEKITMKHVEESDVVLSQQISLMKHGLIPKNNVVCRLGGNKTFEDIESSPARYYLEGMKKCYAIIATNNFLYGVGKKVNPHTYLVPNGINLDKWKPAKKNYRRKDAKLVVGFCGNISTEEFREYKGFKYVEEACEFFSKEVILKQALYNEGQIPHDEMMKKFYHKIDVLVHPTRGEGCSNTILEACACGIPVITTRVAGFHAEYFKDGVDGVFCERDTFSIVKCLKKFLDSKDYMDEIGRNARKFAEKYHDIKMISKQYLAILEDCYNNLDKKESEFVPIKVTEQIKSKPIVKKEDKLIVATVFIPGNGFTEEYVAKMKSMTDRFVKTPHEFVCLTNEKLDFCKTIPCITNWRTWWAKLELFRPNIFGKNSVLYLDLDMILMDTIDKILEHDDGKLLMMRRYRKINKRSSAIMYWQGDYSIMFTNINGKLSYMNRRGITDQDFIMECLFKENKLSKKVAQDYINIHSYKRECLYGIPKDTDVIGFHGIPRPHQVTMENIQQLWK